ncbi:MAG: hypothetical protein LBS41_00455 [Streptococcaceae bacterium]|jgi:hypothetical protein|nr:hypothetical protein [Streptococcaceae bacterium]
MIYLIDYENVHQNGFDGIEAISTADEIYLFIGQSAKIPAVDLKKIMSKNIKLYVTEKTQPDYLDFQLATLLGSLVVTQTDKSFTIVSKDRGYDAVIDFWRQANPAVKILVKQTLSGKAIKTVVKEKNAVKQTGHLTTADQKTIRSSLKDLKIKPTDYKYIYNLFKTEQDKTEFHTKLQKQFGEKATLIYNTLKTEFTRILGQRNA